MIYTILELGDLGIRVGKNPSIDKSVNFFNPERITIGHNVRIDCWSLLSAGEEGISIGRNVHLGASSFVFGGGGRVVLSDFSALSARVSLFTATDDYLQGYLTNPTVPERYKNVRRGPIVLEPHALIGTGSVVLPDVTLKPGCSVGAMTLINRDIGEYEVAFGVPFIVIGRRDAKRMDQLEKEYLAQEGTLD